MKNMEWYWKILNVTWIEFNSIEKINKILIIQKKITSIWVEF
jgi:hypothetical protein